MVLCEPPHRGHSAPVSPGPPRARCGRRSRIPSLRPWRLRWFWIFAVSPVRASFSVAANLWPVPGLSLAAHGAASHCKAPSDFKHADDVVVRRFRRVDDHLIADGELIVRRNLHAIECFQRVLVGQICVFRLTGRSGRRGI